MVKKTEYFLNDIGVKGVVANNTVGATGEVLTSNGSATYWALGPSGYTGSQGIIGYTGSKGDIGFTGSQGIIGYTGSQGIQGVIGFTGSQGIIGYTGSQGVIGFTGSKGDIGFTGSQGIIGYTGSQGVIGFTGSQGIIGYTGSKGDIGYTGSQGVIGYTGSKGDIGFTGSQGIIGYTGSQGVIGFTGSQGIIGYTGSKGDIGYTGSQGVIGYTGSKGDIGFTGSQGIIGYTGSRGLINYEDNRTIAPDEGSAADIKFGFTAWNNDGTTPFADFLHMRSYTDSSGGLDNLIAFRKTGGFGIRQWQQTWGSSTPYSSYVDYWNTSNDGSGSGLDADLLDGYNTTLIGTVSSVPVINSNGEIKWGTGSGIFNGGNPRTVSFGYSGGNYGSIGYGVTYTGVSDTHNYGLSDVPTLIELFGGIRILSAVTGTLGDSIPWSEVFKAKLAESNAYFKSRQIWDSGNDGSGSGLDADLLDGYNTTLAGGNSAIPVISASGGAWINKVGYNPDSDVYTSDGVSSPNYGMILASYTSFGGLGLGLSGYSGMKFATLGLERMRINTSGYIGINEVNPQKYLHITATDQTESRLRIQNTGVSGRAWDIVAGVHNTFQSGFSITDVTANLARFVIDNSGNVGIGTTSPSTKFVVSNADASGLEISPNGGLGSGPYIQAYNRATSAYMQVTNYASAYTWYINATQRMVLDAAGSLYNNGNIVWNAGNDGSGSGLDADLLDGIHAVGLFNNMGSSHSTYTDFNALPNFGSHFVLGTTNGPATGSSNFYALNLGLGSEYPYSDYALQMAISRYSDIEGATTTNGTRYLSLRSREATTWGSWNKIASGLADKIGYTHPAQGGGGQNYVGYGPEGGSYYSGSSSNTGAIRIRLPGGAATHSYAMVSFTVRVFQYGPAQSFDVICHGYTYDDGARWINVSASLVGDPTSNIDLNVRFGYDEPSSRFCVYIGELSTVWSYARIQVLDVGVNYTQENAKLWIDDWNIDYVTSFSTVTHNRSTTAVGKYFNNQLIWNAGNDGAGSGLDADLLDGYNASPSVGANTVAVRDASGYLYTNYINSNTDNNENGTISNIITTNGDGFYRKNTVDNFKSQLNLMSTNVGNNITGANYFISNYNTGAGSSPPLQAYSNDNAQGAVMAFHRSGLYAVNMGLDSDNIFRLGGWSAPPNLMQINTTSGNAEFLGKVTASGAGGFSAKTYVNNSRNPIFRFDNADGFGISYFQGTAGYVSGQDCIGLHFGTATSAGSAFWATDTGDSWTAAISYAIGSHRAPIFYDTDNTGFYIDASGTSNLSALTLGGRSTLEAVYYAGFSLDANTMPGNSTGFTYAVNAPLTGPIARFGETNYCMQMNMSYGGGGGFAVRSRNGDSGTFNTWQYPALYGVNVNGGGDLYAAIYYDQNNTGYYCNPNGLSRLSTALFDGGSLVAGNGDITARRDNGTAGVYYFGNGGPYLYFDGSTFSFAGGPVVAVTDFRAPIFYDVNNTGYYWDGASTSYWNASQQTANHTFLQCGVGVVGTYDSTKFQNVFAMGSPYIGNAAGTSLAGAYGLWWSHPNAGGVAANLTTHGLMTIVNGAWQAQLEASTRAASDMRAPIFYDLNDSNFYCDPTGTSRLVYTVTNYHRRPSHETGHLEGGYNNLGASESYTNPIFTIGSSYNPAATTLASMYGIGYSEATAASFNPSGATTWGMYVANAGVCGIWLEGNGNIWATGNITAYASDKRLKTNIKPISNAIDKLMSITGVEFDWVDNIEEIGFKPLNMHETGVIAQEIQEVIPDAVVLAPFNNHATELAGYDSEYLTVDKEKIIPLLIEAIKEQQMIINRLEQRIMTMESNK